MALTFLHLHPLPSHSSLPSVTVERHSRPTISAHCSSFASTKSVIPLSFRGAEKALRPAPLLLTRPKLSRSVTVRSNLNFPLISPMDQWGNWTALFSIGAFWYLRRLKIRNMISGSLVSILVGIAASNLGIISSEAHAYTIVMKFLLPLAVPLLLFRADLFRVIKSTGTLLLAFLIGSDGGMVMESNSEKKLPVLQSATGLAVSFAICKIGIFLEHYFGIQGGSLSAITAVVVILATTFPKQFNQLAPSVEAMALILMQVFFAVVGASGSLWNVMNSAPSIFMFSLVQMAVHLAVILGLGKLFRFDLKLLLIASNANVGGPTTACGSGMATAKGWT